LVKLPLAGGPGEHMKAECPVCLTEAETAIVEHWHEFSLLHCHACDVVFSQPMRSPGIEWHAELHYCRDIEGATEVGWNHQQFLKDGPAPGGTLLDVGCGTGSFLSRARAAGYTVAGIDLDPHAIDGVRNRLGIDDVQAISLDEFVQRAEGRRFDIVTSFEVLEHQEDPNSFMDQIRTLLKDDGYLALSVPYRDRWPRYKFRWDYPPNHLTRWSKRALEQFLRRHGFEVLTVRTGWIGTDEVLGDKLRLGIIRRLARLSGARPSDSPQRVAVRTISIMRKARSSLLKYVAFPIDAMLSLRGATGSDMYGLARR